MSQDASPVSYQTVRLTQGRHSSPRHGACVMELASMIAHEPFSDRPASVCPVIAAFLRDYNDSIDDRRRQDLYRLAAIAVGTRGSRETERRRIERCLEWGHERLAERCRLHRLLATIKAPVQPPTAAAAGSFAARTITRHNDETHAQAIALVDELCAMNRVAGVHHREGRDDPRRATAEV
jgi:hypothetical protein